MAGDWLPQEQTGEYTFDELSRGLADGTLSRSRALKLAGAAILAGAFGFLALPDEADAKKRRRKKKRKRKRRPRSASTTPTTLPLCQLGQLGCPTACRCPTGNVCRSVVPGFAGICAPV